MSLRNTLQRAVKTAFNALDDVPLECTYKSVSGDMVRDLVAGTSSRVTTNYTLPSVVFAKFSERQTDKDPALLTDMRMIFATHDLPVGPKESDTVVDSLNRVWSIVKRLSDPASVVTILQVRTS